MGFRVRAWGLGGLGLGFRGIGVPPAWVHPSFASIALARKVSTHIGLRRRRGEEEKGRRGSSREKRSEGQEGKRGTSPGGGGRRA